MNLRKWEGTSICNIKTICLKLCTFFLCYKMVLTHVNMDTGPLGVFCGVWILCVCAGNSSLLSSETGDGNFDLGYGECGGQLIITDRIKDDIASRSGKKSQCALKALNLHSLQWPAGGDSFGCKSNSTCIRVFGPHLFLIYDIIKHFLDGLWAEYSIQHNVKLTVKSILWIWIILRVRMNDNQSTLDHKHRVSSVCISNRIQFQNADNKNPQLEA